MSCTCWVQDKHYRADLFRAVAVARDSAAVQFFFFFEMETHSIVTCIKPVNKSSTDTGTF